LLQRRRVIYDRWITWYLICLQKHEIAFTSAIANSQIYGRTNF